MGGVMQSGVTTAEPEPPLSVCHRLRTGTHSSDRKVRPSSVQLLHYLSIHPLIHLSTYPSFSMVFMHCVFPIPRATAASLWHPPTCLPTHLLMSSSFPPAQYLHYLTTNPRHVPPLCLWDSLTSSFIKSFHCLFSSQQKCTTLVDSC